MDNAESFEFTYSAPEQEEVRRIREKYLPKPESKLEQLRRLDAGVTKKATTVSLAFGVLGTLIMGGGMSMCMVWGGMLMIPGILVGVLGIVGIILAYPVYCRTVEKERQRIAPEVLRLTEEIRQESLTGK